MGLGVLDCKRTPLPPGSVVLEDVRKMVPDANAPDYAYLKRDGDTILQPQPSDSPNDPLNWSVKIKMSIFLSLIVGMTAIGGVTGMLSTSFRMLATKYHVTYPELIKILHPPALAANAVALFFVSAVAAVWGKRLPIVLGTFTIWINMLAGYFANSLNYYRALGIVNSIFGAGPELLIAPLITDLVYVHQRGRFLALSTLVGVIGSDASHVIAGNVIKHLGVKYLYIISFAVMAPIVVAIFILVRETTYMRKLTHIPTTPITAPLDVANDSDRDSGGNRKSTDKRTSVTSKELSPTITTLSSEPESKETEQCPANEAKHPWYWYLPLYRGRVTNRKFFSALLQPIPLMIFPSVCFSTVVNGAMMSWATISGIISHQVLLYPPYNLQPDVLAYIGLPGSISSLVGSIMAGFLSDWIITKMAKRNGGIYEPEFRLVMLIPATILTTIGFFLLGPLFHEHAKVWKLVLTSQLFYFAGPFSSSACVTYIFDTMQNTATEAFVATSLFKLMYMSFATTYVPDWFAKNGPINTYRLLGILNLVFAALAIPMYMFGKRARGMCARSDFLNRAARSAKTY